MIKLTREEMPQAGQVFVAMPYRTKNLADGKSFNFDDLYDKIYAPTIRECGMDPERADLIFGTAEGVFDTVWRGVQRAEVVVVDCTARSVDVALELMMAIALNKRLVVLAQRLEDIPVDVRGHIRPIIYQMEDMGIVDLIRNLKDNLTDARAKTVIENTLVPFKEAGTKPMAGKIFAVSRDRVVVEPDEDRGEMFTLGNADVDYTRFIADMTRLFRVGERVEGAIATDFADGTRRYTMLADQTNPWPGLVADFPVGKRFTSRVVNVVDGVGGFVAVASGVNGHISFAEVRQGGVQRDSDVEVEVIRIDAAARKVGLRLHRVLTPFGSVGTVGMVTSLASRKTAVDPQNLPTVGTKLVGRIVRAEPEQGHRGGYALLGLQGFPASVKAMLHCKQMSQELREDLNDAEVDLIDEEIPVMVLKSDAASGRIEVLEVEEEDDSGQDGFSQEAKAA